jgi:hypothetical protein
MQFRDENQPRVTGASRRQHALLPQPTHPVY